MRSLVGFAGRAPEEERAMVTRKLMVVSMLGLLGAAGLVALAERVASESGEVVVLTTQEASGAPVQTRLWVVDLDGSQYLRGDAGSGWYARLLAVPRVRLERDGLAEDHLAVPAAEQRAQINELMRRKYGWRDAYISWLLGGREEAMPVRLAPL
jgi:hypothetical protein